MGADDIARVPKLYWLPKETRWKERLRALRTASEPSAAALQEAIALANTQLDFLQTNMLDQVVRELFRDQPPQWLSKTPIRLGILASSTVSHLHAGLRVAALRRGLWLTVYEHDFGQYLQELLDPKSGLHDFRPTAVLFAFDIRHLTMGLHAGIQPFEAEGAFADTRNHILRCWHAAREAFQCLILQQTILPALPGLLGNNEHRLPGSPQGFIERLNSALPAMADQEAVDLVGLDRCAMRDGISYWHDAALWHRSKQEICLRAAPVYGELVGRLLAAKQGHSYKCLVLDLDNTIWGGVLGDDGIEGIVLGQGSALGEAYQAMQQYALELSRRGILLAICSKNDEKIVREAFDNHPEMLLKRNCIASFVVNWNDKAANLRAIAQELNIGINTLVFVDDNPAERMLVRKELPMVAVPEVPGDPALVPSCLSDGGYFEAVNVTDEDRQRTRFYKDNWARSRFQESTTDLNSYLQALQMRLLWRAFDRIGLRRILQLINKTNQFNLTTRRYTEDEILALMEDPLSFGLQLRLIDRFGDNGIIGIVIGRQRDDNDLLIDTWLMSCRVLGRQVEKATLNVVVLEAQKRGACRLVGEYRSTEKNEIVRNHYLNLGFSSIERSDQREFSTLDLKSFQPMSTVIAVERDLDYAAGDEQLSLSPMALRNGMNS